MGQTLSLYFRLLPDDSNVRGRNTVTFWSRCFGTSEG
jgi:hypothetical protein